MFTKIATPTGDIHVRLDRISAITPALDGSAMHIEGGRIIVSLPPADLLAKINDARRIEVQQAAQVGMETADAIRKMLGRAKGVA